jgi:hypothetical protein
MCRPTGHRFRARGGSGRAGRPRRRGSPRRALAVAAAQPQVEGLVPGGHRDAQGVRPLAAAHVRRTHDLRVRRPPRVPVGHRTAHRAPDHVHVRQLGQDSLGVGPRGGRHGDVQREPVALADPQPAAQRDALTVVAVPLQAYVEPVQQMPVVDPDPARAHPRHHRAVAVAGHAHMGAAELAGPEVAAGLRGVGLHRVGQLAGVVEVLPVGPGAVGPSVVDRTVVVGVRGDREQPALGQHRVPQPADGRRRPVETAVRHIRVRRIARPGLRRRLVLVLAADRRRTAPAGEGRALGAGCALHADHDLGGRVPPGAHLVRGVDAQAQRVVGEDEDVVDVARTALLGQPLDGLHGVGLVAGGVRVGGAALVVAQQLAVVGEFELREQIDLVAAGRGEHRAVLGGRDVPLQALEDQLAGVLGARLEDLGVLQLRAVGGVSEVGVLVEHHPVEAVLRGGLACWENVYLASWLYTECTWWSPTR